VTCTHTGFEHLRYLSAGKSPVHLSYHGLDLARFGRFDGWRSETDGSVPEEPVAILSVGRDVQK
jgi:hypothetical protein